MDIISQINTGDLSFAVLTVFTTVFLIIFVKIFGGIATSGSAIGTEFNLLTYGYLWDTCLDAVRGRAYWPRFDLSSTFLTKPLILLLVCLANFLIMAWNMKIESIINRRTNASINPSASVNVDRVTKWFLKPMVMALGVLSLLIFLFLNSAWS